MKYYSCPAKDKHNIMSWHPNSIVAVATARINGAVLSESQLHMDEFDSFEEVRDHIATNAATFLEDNDLEDGTLLEEVNTLVDRMESFHEEWSKNPKLDDIKPEMVEFVESNDKHALTLQIKATGLSFHMHYEGADNINNWDQLDIKIHWL